MVSMFVPVLGEIMLTVMAGQLLYESFEGAIEWSEGDRTAAKAHLIDVAENLAMIAVMAGAGKGLAKLSSVQPEPLVERLQPIQREDGKTRLWKADLSGYERNLILLAIQSLMRRLHRINGKTFIRQDGKVFETTLDPSLKNGACGIRLIRMPGNRYSNITGMAPGVMRWSVPDLGSADPAAAHRPYHRGVFR
jgi:hypothetical protein